MKTQKPTKKEERILILVRATPTKDDWERKCARGKLYVANLRDFEKKIGATNVFSSRPLNHYALTASNFLPKSAKCLESTMEPPWLDNKQCVSCVPEGLYDLIKRKTGRYATIAKERWGHSWVYGLKKVKGRFAILIHWGSRPKDTQGCIMVGHESLVKGKWMLLYSRSSYNAIWKDLRDNPPTQIFIRNATPSMDRNLKKYLNYQGHKD